MTNEEIAAILEHGEIEIEGRITDSSNQALFVTVTLDGVSLSACYKTEVGERPLWDFPSGLWRREVAAFQLSELMGLNVIPVTVARKNGPFAPGSLQQWISGTTSDHYFTLRDRPELETWFRHVALFDVVANNADRKSGHVIFDGSRCWGIDQGLCFGETAHLRTVMWEFAGEPLNIPEIGAIGRVAHSDLAPLSSLISVEEVAALLQRAKLLQESGIFPEPNEDSDWPPYPWPLI